MSTDKGYIKLYRDIRDHWIWQDSEYVKAWIDLIMMMNHTDTQILFNKQLITVKRGSRVTSIRKLGKRWGWSRDRVKRFLDLLEDDGMIATVRDTQKTLVTVEKYGFYQAQDGKRATRTSPPTRPQTSPRTSPHASHREDIIEGTKEGIKNKAAYGEYLDDEPITAEEIEEGGWGFE